MGERRLRILEGLLPDGTFVLGVDEHTACILDLDAGTMTVAGLGAVTVRRAGTSTRFEAASVVAIDALRDASVSGAGGAGGASGAGDAIGSAPVPGEARPPTHEQLAVSPLLGDVARCEQSFDEALVAGDARGAVKAVLELDDVLHDWATDTLQSDELDRGRSVLRSLIVRLGDVAEVGVRDRREVVGPFVDPLLQVRERARRDRRFDEADAVRDALTAAGVEVRDTPQGPEWGLLS
jgi:hypothetical protein